MGHLLRLCALALLFALPLSRPAAADLQTVLQENAEDVIRASRRTVEDVLAALLADNDPALPAFLEEWRGRNVYVREADGLFVYVEEIDRETYRLLDIVTRAEIGTAGRREVTQLRPNSGVQGVIASALVEFQLRDPDPARRAAALDAIARNPEAGQLGPLTRAAEAETDPVLAARGARLVTFLTIAFADETADRVAAIQSLSGDLSLDARAALNPLLTTRLVLAEGEDPPPGNIAAEVRPGSETLGWEAAYEMLVQAGRAPAQVSDADRNAALVANLADGRVAGVAVASLNTEAARDAAYAALAAEGIVPPRQTEAERRASAAAAQYYLVYTEADPAVTAAAEQALDAIELRVALNQFLDLSLDALSLASIYFLAAIGLAITFGVMGVINMAHGEFIMMGAYTGYVVQLFVPDYTLSILIALPLAFAVTFAAGVAMERLVIRWLYNRPLETLLATFGISIALQQLAKNIFGTQARPLTSPGWLDGAWVLNDIVSISYIRIAIFGLGVLFFVLLLLILNRTRLGLEVRAVTQNPRMAASMGINPDRINMLTFGLGSGIAGIAGVAIGLYAKVTSEMGADYIVQSFMTVVVGGVGNIWGTLLGATLIGSLQKGIEWFNPSNTLAAQTYMILFIILFIQFRPKGIIALKGRAAGE